MRTRSMGALAGAVLLAASSVPQVYAKSINNRNGISHVLLISVDGMHAVDLANCSQAGTCSNLAALAKTGLNYVDTSTSKPSDSFPGLMALVTGGSPRAVGAFYDVAYDHSLAPPTITTGNGVAAGPCNKGNPGIGTRTEYDEGIDINQDALNAGDPVGDGTEAAIDPLKLIRDPNNNCNPVFPWNFIRTNTIFGVIHGAGGYTAWEDKHVSYSAVSGPGDGSNVDDYFGPEINSTSVPMPQVTRIPGLTCDPLPDSLAAGNDDYTGSFQNIQCYDGLKVQGILNQIDGLTHNGSAKAPVPNLFGMNFQAVSIGQKLIYQHGNPPTVAKGYSVHGGYTDSTGTPSDSLNKEIEFVDTSIGLMVTELKKQNLYNSTLIIITAKHGQSPIDLKRFLPIPGPGQTPNGTPPSAIVADQLFDSETTNPDPSTRIKQIGPPEDDISLLWLTDSSPASVAEAVSDLEENAVAAGIGQIFSGPTLGLMYNLGDPRTPDIIVQPNVGVVYTGSKKKDAEHGGFAHDDVNVIMLLSNPSFTGATITSPVETTQVAPSILTALGLDGTSLQAVQQEGTQVLPGLPFK